MNRHFWLAVSIIITVSSLTLGGYLAGKAYTSLAPTTETSTVNTGSMKAVSVNKKITRAELSKRNKDILGGENDPYTAVLMKESGFETQKPTFDLAYIVYKSVPIVLQPRSAVLKQYQSDEEYLQIVTEQYKDFPLYAGYYMSKEHDISNIVYADIDKDGQKEALVTYGYAGSNHCCNFVDVIKNNRVIATITISPYGDGAISASQGIFTISRNVFFEGSGLCCPDQIIETNFVMKDGKVMPTSERKYLTSWYDVTT